MGDGARRLAGARVLVSGLRGTGAQVAAALVAAGTGRVVLHDGGTARTADRGQQFLLGESDVGQNRAEASQRVLAELNPHTVVAAHTGELSEAFLASFQVVVLTESSLEEQLRIGDFCHDRGICFIVADAKGLAGQLFCDFGKHFIVEDPAEGDPVCAIVQDISQGNPGVVTYVGTEESYGHLFSDGDLVRFSGVEGMTELNDQEPIRVRALGEPPRLEICDTSSFSPYRCGGLVSQVRLPQERSYVSPPSSPRCCHQGWDTAELPRSRSLHAAFWALHAFQRERGHLPRPRAPVSPCLAPVRSPWTPATLPGAQGPLDEDVVRAFASVSAGDLCPVAAITGAMAAQEVLKAITGKFLPLDQWLYFDALECLALEGAERLTEEDCAPRGSRYDGQIAVFGDAFQERLGSQKYFVVGAGAIGCELLKNFAMMGLAAGPGGDITVTDMDSIAPSNLHRQLLYRTADVSKPKSEVAAAAVRRMNPDIKVTPHQNQVGPATELLYGDDFFRSLDGVASALDTLEARAYLESRCLRYLTPLLDSGTEGPRGNVLPVVPALTDLLRPGATPRDGTFPLCTLRYFPRTIQHTLQWARDEFEGLFQLPAEHVQRFMEDPGFPEQLPAGKALEVLEQVRWSLRERPGDWQDCLRWARRHWQSRYHDAIAQLLHNYPPEHETSPGVPFWSGDKSCPRPLTFDPDNDTHLDYILAAAHLFAQAHKVPPCNDRTAAQDILRSMVLPPFVPQDGLQIPLTEEQEEGQVPADTRQLAELTRDLVQRRQELVGGEVAQVPLMDPIYFEKDDDIHVNFITAASNLRAENYGIPPADWMTSKRIAGRILPAIITTTAAVAGLACLEVYKLVWGCRDLSRYRNSHLWLSDSATLCSPLQYGGREWSCWDRLEMRADGQEVTVQEVLDWLEVSMGQAAPNRVTLGGRGGAQGPPDTHLLQKTHGWTATKLLHGYTMLYDREEEEETRTQQLAQR
uniref:Ubiquitin-activating enzyme E1 n=1 Tax=Calidris pygmaea TaxID=425635 RepID=A0A8C3PI45_9CHAR